MRSVIKGVQRPVLVTLVLLVICGLLYPLLLTGISQLLFPSRANGSFIVVDGKAVGSEIVGQAFADPRFMKGRPSAVNYNTYTQAEKESGTYTGVSSGSKNYAATNPDLVARVEADLAAFLAANPAIRREEIPTDLLTASGSGLDPHISPAAAAVQLPAIAGATGLTMARLEEIVADCTEGKLLGIYGEVTVNVLKVNLEIARAVGAL